MKQKSRVFVAMSGGVDSSVAALLLKRRGFDVTGVFIRSYNLDGCAVADAEDARRVAAHLGIPFYVFDFEKEYKKEVVEYMIRDYRSGITPNPDVMCNKEIKFGIFLKKALSLGADYIATGHYVRREISNSQLVIRKQVGQLPITNYQLCIARDTNKDQSYFLWTLTQKQLKYCLFPIGDYLKPKVREMARKAGLPTAEKKDSQGICFLGKVSLVDFLKKYLPSKRGLVLDEAGKKVGEHDGSYFYTIGQRRGIGNIKHARGNQIHKPVYIAKKDVKKNILVVAEGESNPALYQKEIRIKNVNFIKLDSRFEIKDLKVLARVRYRQPLARATLQKLKAKSWKLTFEFPQKFVAPGQSTVFYSKKGEMLGGGIIR